MTQDAGSVLIIGAGWAGLAAAVRLREAGAAVTLIDSAPRIGGRARSLQVGLDDASQPLDNGQHLLIGAYHRVLALRDTVQASGDTLARQRLHLHSSDGIRLQTDRWPGRLGLAYGLLTAKGLSLRERLAMMRLIATLPSDHDTHWPPGLTVQRWLQALRQPDRLCARIWRPLCLGALNTPMDQACARTFARVLRDSFRGHPSDSDFLLTRGPLDGVLPEPAARWLQAHGVKVRCGVTARALERADPGGWRVRLDAGDSLRATQVLLATPALQTARLLRSLALTESTQSIVHSISDIRHAPIATVWIGWKSPLTLPAMIALQDSADAPGQWLFDRTDATQIGAPLRALASVVVSAPGPEWDDPRHLQRAVIAQIGRELSLPTPSAARTVIERRATPACTPDRLRLNTDALQDECAGLWLAGDWVWHAYPGTLEGAARSGEAAAEQIRRALARAQAGSASQA